jgi:putative tryptophan/tyrosine transport system substrate-binding protein
MPNAAYERRLRSAAAVAGAVLVAAFAASCSGSDGENDAATDVPQVGLMHVGLDHVPTSLDGLVTALEKEYGWDLPDRDVERCLEEKRASCRFRGENVELIWKNLDKGTADVQADVFVRQGVDVIVAFEDQSISAAQKATVDTRTPIVFLHPTDPVRAGLVESLRNSPQSNITGLFQARDLVARQLELYTQLVPGLERVLALVDPKSPSSYELDETKAAAERLGVELVIREATEAADIQRIFRSLEPGEVDAVLVLSSSLRLYHTALLLRLTERARLPVQAHRKDWVEQGALFSYGSDLFPIGAAAARYVDSILAGTAPSELAVQQIPDVTFALNTATARRLGIEVPKRMIIRADVVYK